MTKYDWSCTGYEPTQDSIRSENNLASYTLSTDGDKLLQINNHLIMRQNRHVSSCVSLRKCGTRCKGKRFHSLQNRSISGEIGVQEIVPLFYTQRWLFVHIVFSPFDKIHRFPLRTQAHGAWSRFDEAQRFFTVLIFVLSLATTFVSCTDGKNHKFVFALLQYGSLLSNKHGMYYKQT